MISGSRFFAECMGIAPEGELVATRSHRCIQCGGEITPGERHSTFTPKDSFQDWNSLQLPGSTALCGFCQATNIKKYMKISMKGIVSKEGFFPFGSNEAIAYWLLNPPPPPFMVFINNTQSAYVVWKTPVTLDANMILIRLDDQILRIRRTLILAAYEAYKVIKASAQALFPNDKVWESYKPFFIDRHFTNSNHGAMTQRDFQLLKINPELTPAYKAIEALNPGELWALRNLMLAKEITRPEEKTFLEQAS